MVEMIKPMAEWCSAIIEILGVGLITLFAIYALLIAAVRLLKGRQSNAVFKEARQKLGRGILVGLEFLVAADIIRTVAVELAIESVGVLFIIVLIRTFLSFTLEVELTGNWPWQNDANGSGG
ncbi:MAG: DUF1622 domain-containing protein [Synechococcales bacterium]|nr:DUF1622 domain-containing protein [Synechococcales bacterium]